MARTHKHNPASKFRNYTPHHHTTFFLKCLFCDNANQHTKKVGRSFIFHLEFPAVVTNCRLALAKLENKLKQQQKSICAASKRKKYSFIHSSLAIFLPLAQLPCLLLYYCLYSFSTRNNILSLWLLLMYLVYFSNL